MTKHTYQYYTASKHASVNTTKTTIKDQIVSAIKPLAISSMVIGACYAFFPQELINRQILTSKTWQATTYNRIETVMAPNKVNQEQARKEANKPVLASSIIYDVYKSSQMVFLPNNQYQKVTLITMTSKKAKSIYFRYSETGNWQISGNYIEAKPTNVGDDSFDSEVIDILQQHDLIALNTKQTYRLNYKSIDSVSLNDLAFKKTEYL
ncbi:hypothetical protein A3K86_02785 [Photobacterium jeanii]|uniref:Uncharacterized protein n=1 Tax=Photobacterium jeanii TaxID=858640 RepID=A0A178KKV6_9GAMM|nr:regulatory protein ToxS [Photobacterium jeanii]OAN17860.1 hypothetical protein A3K86_02785 [Photobacterium jeanii]PST92472.1 hypothetical protein C9I91_04685 [Photobacterium jeanii]